MEGVVGQDYLGKALRCAETSEWLDWLRENLTMGGVSLPIEEVSVLYVERALDLADRIEQAHRTLPVALRHKLVGSAIVYQCWDAQREMILRRKWPRKRAPLRCVEAVGYVRPVGRSGRHHLVQGHDGYQYVITLGTGLWSETMPAGEVIAAELARMFGLKMAECAIVEVTPDVLRIADAHRAGEFRRQRDHRECCFGSQFVDVPSVQVGCTEEAAAPVPDILAGKLLDMMVFDNWMLNWRPREFAVLTPDSSGLTDLIFFDNSQCFVGGDWFKYAESTHAQRSAGVGGTLHARVLEDLGRSLGGVLKIDMNPIWELAFEMPESWYGGNRPAVIGLLQAIERRKFDLGPLFAQWFLKTGPFRKTVESVHRLEEKACGVG